MFSVEDIKKAMKDADVNIDPEKIASTHNLRDAGLDSLDLFNIFLEIEKLYGKEIPDEDFEKLQTIESILTYINREK